MQRQQIPKIIVSYATTPEDDQAIRRAAEKMNLTRGAFVRMVVRGWLAAQGEEPAKDREAA